MSDLFGHDAPELKKSPPSSANSHAPLAERLRPQSLQEVIGQDHLLGDGGAISSLVAKNFLPSLILWGPPGVGKTTIARLLARAAGYEFMSLSAVHSGIADLKKTFEMAKERQKMGQKCLLFVDEIHRFNRAQQDGFLPAVEAGLVTLIGATTENPSFELNGALLSRMQVFVLNRLDEAALELLIKRAEALLGPLMVTDEGRALLVALCDGDGRYLLSLVETVSHLAPDAPLGPDALLEVLQKRRPNQDKDREGHYNLISALHKSVRGSDPDAALYWLARMLKGGDDPLFIARRLIRMASEDIGAADPMALVVAVAARDSYEALGSPEGELMLAHCVVHLATAPKSNAVYQAYKAAMRLAEDTQGLMPPKIILNAPTKLMKNEGYGAGYIYDHDTIDGFSGQNYFPDGLKRPTLYEPKNKGLEARIAERLAHWASLRSQT